MENRTIYLVRHGKIQLQDEQRRYIGQLDLPLAAEGVRQAQCLQKRIDRTEFSAVICSDLTRSRQTAEIIAKHKEVPIMPRADLREISLGQWEGLTFAEVERQYPREFEARGMDIGYYRVPGGESFADCGRRVVAAFQEILGTVTGDILLSGHAGVNRLLLCQVLGLPLTNLFRLGQDYGCLNVIHSGSYGYQVNLINSRS